MEIYFVACKEASVRQFNRRFVSARCVLRSNQAATVCLRPSYRQITVSLFYRRYHRTAIRIMIKLVCPTARSSHVCRHPARLPDERLARLLLPSICSVVCLPVGRPSIHTLAWQFQSLSPPPPPVTRALRVSLRPPVRRYQVAYQILAETQLQSIVRCSHGLASTSAAATQARVVL